MAEARILLFLAALLVYCALLVRCKVASALAPLVAVCGTVLWFALFGVAGLLRLGGWVYYLCALAVLGYLVYYRFIQKHRLKLFSWGLCFFALCSLVAIALLWAKQPEFFTWDEFSFWGTAQKLTKLNDALYPVTQVGWAWPASQMPGLIVFGYAGQFFGSAFLPWQVYAACNIFQFAAMAALLLPFGRRQWHIALPVGVTALLVPYAFTLYAQPWQVTSVYMDSLADIPMGLQFGAALAVYAASRGAGLKKQWPVLLTLLVLSLTKDPMGPVLALLAALVMLADVLFASRRPKRVGRALGGFFVSAAVAGGGFLLWKVYISLATRGATAGGGGGGTEDTSLLQIPVRFVQDLFSGGNPQFSAVMRGMPGQYVSNRFSMLGSGLVLTGIILFLLGAAAFIMRSKRLRRRCIVYGAAGAFCLALYHFVLAVAYIYIMREDQLFASFERYVYPYYIGWFLAAVVLLGMAAKRSRFAIEGRLLVLAVCAVLCLRVAQLVPVSYTIAGVNSGEFNYLRRFNAEAEALTAGMGPEDKSFVVTGGADDGSLWFRLCYALLPYQIDYSFGGGEFLQSVEAADGTTYKEHVGPAAWLDYLAESGCTLVLLYDVDEAFTAEYGALFSDALAAYEAGETQLYRVETGAGGVALVPLV